MSSCTSDVVCKLWIEGTARDQGIQGMDRSWVLDFQIWGQPGMQSDDLTFFLLKISLCFLEIPKKVTESSMLSSNLF